LFSSACRNTLCLSAVSKLASSDIRSLPSSRAGTRLQHQP
jgi:hypothetical protein